MKEGNIDYLGSICSDGIFFNYKREKMYIWLKNNSKYFQTWVRPVDVLNLRRDLATTDIFVCNENQLKQGRNIILG